MRNIAASVLLPALALLGACQAYVARVESDAVDQEYSKPSSEVCAAVLQSSEAAGFQVTSEKKDALGGDLMASRGDGTDIRIHVKALGKKRSRVSVRVKPWDRSLAESMHERIAGTLGSRPPGAGDGSGQ